MLKSIKKRLKNQRGLTLIELLAVVVILGIIAAIAVPNIGKIIDNTKVKARVANAQQFVDASKLYVNSGIEKSPAEGASIDVTLAELTDQGLFDGDITDPITDDTYDTTSKVTITKTSGKLVYTVTLTTTDDAADPKVTPIYSAKNIKDIK